MNIPINSASGQVLRTLKGSLYEVLHFERVAESPEPTYIFGIAPSEPSLSDRKNPHCLYSGVTEFCAHFAPDFVAPADFGDGEQGDVNYTLWVLGLSLDNPLADDIQLNENGQYVLYFP